MTQPRGKLTPAQYEILELVWDAVEGATVTEIWEAINARRDVTRNTIINLVDRLEKRGWLKRQKKQGSFRYVAALDRDTTSRLLASEFVDEFFGGSASHLVMSLLGPKRLRPADVQRLRRLLDGSGPHESKGDK